ncbi:DUF1501 domain-containing protein [Gimesia chilikensis]|uniref:DUF1501 domain-containing protein n=1 Tax=Gimesia chilikensis TaxID=2605989 RepID=UPI0011ECE69D|nr:DUF1501 domain-containing protein [Gimesia chilikensis]KAA0136982.1 DUF1501 domain-containing protein [Gimesia chilikensis]
MPAHSPTRHPLISRRTALEVGSVSLLGMGINHLDALRAQAAGGTKHSTAKSCIFIFLSGGLSQHESFDMKPNASAEIRGEFDPIATRTPGVQISEHLPMLAQRSHLWSVCRTLSHGTNEHSMGHHIMLTGRSDIPTGFNPGRPMTTDHPSIAAIAGDVLRSRTNLPPAIVLPDKIVHRTGRVIPGQFAGRMGSNRDPWIIEASPFHAQSYGAFPDYAFDHQQRGGTDKRVFKTPHLKLSQGMTHSRMSNRIQLLKELGAQRQMLDNAGQVESFDRYRTAAISLLNDDKVHYAMDVTSADDKIQERYGKNSFGWSLLMARRLVETGVNLVQVNLGNNESWDTHGNIFPHLKDKLLPPTDRAVSALLDDLHESGQLKDTLVVMCSEFGRTPKISQLAKVYANPGRDHWGATQSILLAGGGVKGGRVVGKTDKIGGFPIDQPQKPENFAATIYKALGLPQTAFWQDDVDRPHYIYEGEPIPGLT